MNPTDNINRINEIVNHVVEEIEKAEQSISIEFRQKQASVDKNFEITHREMVARFCEAGGDPIGKVKAYIIRHTRMDCGLYIGSINDTSEQAGVSRSTVKRVFNNLQYGDIIRLYEDRIWAVHPKFLRKGGSGKYLGQLKFYNSLPKKKRPPKEEQERDDEDSAMAVKLKNLREGKTNVKNAK